MLLWSFIGICHPVGLFRLSYEETYRVAVFLSLLLCWCTFEKLIIEGRKATSGKSPGKFLLNALTCCVSHLIAKFRVLKKECKALSKGFWLLWWNEIPCLLIKNSKS